VPRRARRRGGVGLELESGSVWRSGKDPTGGSLPSVERERSGRREWAGQAVGPAGWAAEGEKIEGRGRGRKRTRARPKEIEKRGFGLEREGERERI